MNIKTQGSVSLGVIIGNRDFFPDKLVGECRSDLMEAFQKAQKCAALFKKHADEIMGVLVVLPNFGDEKEVAETLKLTGLNVPVLVQAYPDDLNKLDVARRRDAWCGKISVCNNLYQYGIKYTITKQHVIHPSNPEFIQELKDFVAVCRVVKGLRKVRIGAVGARPGAFNTVRYSEKILQRNGISVVTIDLSHILGHANKLTKDDQPVKERLEKIKAYSP